MTEAQSSSSMDLNDLSRVNHAYEATFTYHHGLVQVRFATLALYLGAAAFLGNLVFANTLPPSSTRLFLPLAGATLAIGCLLLDLRTYGLLRQLVARGADQEAAMKIPKTLGFFDIMSGASTSGGILGKPRWLVSHSRVFDAIYCGSLLVWIYLAAVKR